MNRNILLHFIFITVIAILQPFCTADSNFIVGESDTTAPVTGTEIVFKDVKNNSAIVSWGAGKDDVTAESDLQYKLVFSKDINEINTIDSAVNCSIIDWRGYVTETAVTNLDDNTKYYFTVILRDIAGNKALYEPKEIKTITGIEFLSAVQTGGESSMVNTTGLTLSFSADPATLTADNISITGAEKGSLSGIGTTRNISLSNITIGNGETVSVSVSSPAGYILTKSPQTAVVYRFLNIYVCGYITDTVKKAGYWKNGNWTALPPIDPAKESCANSIAVSGTDVYAGGYNINTSDTTVAVYWKNGSRIDLESTADSIIYSIKTLGTDVYACGHRQNQAGYWKNGAWTSLPVIDPTKKSESYSIKISGSDIFICGHSKNNSDIKSAGYWKNGELTTFSSIDSSSISWTVSIIISGSDIYNSGMIGHSNAPYAACYWKNGKRTDLPSIDQSKMSGASSIGISGSDIYVCGISTNSSSIIVPGYWKNDIWTTLPAIDPAKSSFVNTMQISGPYIYFSGYSTDSLNIMRAGYWKNGIWNAIPIPAEYGNENSEINDMVIVP